MKTRGKALALEIMLGFFIKPLVFALAGVGLSAVGYSDEAMPSVAIPAGALDSDGSNPDSGVLRQLDSMSELNDLAGDTYGVFVFVPDRSGSSADAPVDLMQSAVRALEPFLNGGRIGVFALAPGSTDYNQIRLMMAVPGVLAVVRGRGASAATGDLTESKLLNAFAAAASTGGCGPSGCI